MVQMVYYTLAAWLLIIYYLHQKNILFFFSQRTTFCEGKSRIFQNIEKQFFSFFLKNSFDMESS
jgi:hypothetical protein